ncbi:MULTISPECIES: type I toxin-antitoxin system Fst family toxin [Enterococcus]
MKYIFLKFFISFASGIALELFKRWLNKRDKSNVA